jgi:hypothetical protein
MRERTICGHDNEKDNGKRPIKLDCEYYQRQYDINKCRDDVK